MNDIPMELSDLISDITEMRDGSDVDLAANEVNACDSCDTGGSTGGGGCDTGGSDVG
ncbi:hypothetical protein V1T76_28960 [Roseibium sp. FZY0029]|uniref:hypothetical protein n=1 Tax=Roseibium sp. FZY0029 TaxID=3116647 RepID=UPI002EAD2D1D|nr:hypothetical protein [Roseibium sp. FZY0029]